MQRRQDHERRHFPAPAPHRDQPRPTHFVALRITDPTVRQAAREAQQDLVKIAPHAGPWLHHVTRLHLTLFPLALLTKEAVDHASALLQSSEPLLRRHYPGNAPRVRFSGMGQFGNRIVWMGAAEDAATAALIRMIMELEDIYIGAGYAPQRTRDFVLHATLLRPTEKFVPKHQILTDRLLEPFRDRVFGENEFSHLELCRMGSWAPDGFYESLTKLPLAPTVP